MSDVQDANAGYEKRDVNIKLVTVFSLLTIVFVTVCLIGLNEYFNSVKEAEYYQSVLQPASPELRDMQAAEERVLTSYRVIDKNKGVYAIPVESAMKLMSDEAFKSSR